MHLYKQKNLHKLKQISALLFKMTPYCDASVGSCLKSSFSFDSAAYQPILVMIRPSNKWHQIYKQYMQRKTFTWI